MLSPSVINIKENQINRCPKILGYLHYDNVKLTAGFNIFQVYKHILERHVFQTIGSAPYMRGT